MQDIYCHLYHHLCQHNDNYFAKQLFTFFAARWTARVRRLIPQIRGAARARTRTRKAKRRKSDRRPTRVAIIPTDLIIKPQNNKKTNHSFCLVFIVNYDYYHKCWNASIWSLCTSFTKTKTQKNSFCNSGHYEKLVQCLYTIYKMNIPIAGKELIHWPLMIY